MAEAILERAVWRRATRALGGSAGTGRSASASCGAVDGGRAQSSATSAWSLASSIASPEKRSGL